MNKKRIFALVMVLTLVLSSTVFAFAEVQPRDTDMVYYSIERISRTSAEALVDVTFSMNINRYTIAIYLQKNVNGEWINDTTNEDYVFYDSGNDGSDYTFTHVYTHLTSGVNYRLKCTSTDYIGSTSHVTTTYSNQF